MIGLLDGYLVEDGWVLELKLCNFIGDGRIHSQWSHLAYHGHPLILLDITSRNGLDHYVIANILNTGLVTRPRRIFNRQKLRLIRRNVEPCTVKRDGHTCHFTAFECCTGDQNICVKYLVAIFLRLATLH